MAEFASYLGNLKFDPQLLRTIHAKYIRNVRLVLLILLVILAVGITSLLALPRRLNPEIKLTIVQVMTVIPGAGPEDVESLITIPLEDKLSGVKNLDTITSISQESVSVISMQFISGTDKDKARNDVQNAVNEVTTLPANAKTPKVEALDFENQPIWTFALTGNTDYASLMRFANSFKDKLADLPHVDQVALSGYDDQEIQIIMNEEKIRDYGLSPLIVSQTIKAATQAYPAGQVDTGSSTLSLAIEAQAKKLDDIRNLPLFLQGQPLRLGDIAEVTERSKLNQDKSYILAAGGGIKPAVTFYIFKTSSSDIDKTVKEVESLADTTIKGTGGRFQIQTITNAGEEIDKQFTDLIGEFQSTLILVFINLFLFLGIRQALIAIMTIPLTFLLSFFWMNMFGMSVNFISLFALLLAFGTSIDDTIVTVSAMSTYYRTGKFTPVETGLLVWRDFIVPIWTTTVTTVWAFLPLILSTGIIGEFIKPIPIVVATTMYSSTFVAWFITLPLMIILLRPEVPRRVKILITLIGLALLAGLLLVVSPKNLFLIPILIVFIVILWVTYRFRSALLGSVAAHARSHPAIARVSDFLKQVLNRGFINTKPLGNAYRSLITRILSSRRGRRITLVCIAIFTFSSYLLIPLGLVKNEFFSKTNVNYVYVGIELPSGTSPQVAAQESTSVLSTLRRTPNLVAAVAQTNAKAPTENNGGGAGPNNLLFTLILQPKEQRTLTSDDIAGILRQQFESYTKGKVAVTEQSGGPPAGADIQIKLSGDDLAVLNRYAEKTISYLKTIKGTANVDKSIKGGTSKIVFVPDKTKLAAAGITLDSLGLWLRTYASGFSFDQVRFNNKNEDTVFYTSAGSQNPVDLGKIAVQTPNGFVPLISLGTFELQNNPTAITREAGKRTLSVTASILAGYSVSDVNRKLETFANSGLALPEGYAWKTGGVNEENQKSVTSIFQAMGLSFLLIMATMVIEFGSYRQAAMILALIPFAISGVFIMFGLTGTPLSFPALIGVLALFGVVVTNAMFIVEKINQNRRNGMPIIQAIADAGESRLEPIMLTSITSILGLIPITLANALWRGLGGAIISGLLFSGLIMLFFIPVTYYVFYHSSEKEQKKQPARS